jgi:hypothetical protein
MIHAGEVTPGRRGKAVERARADENAVQVKQGRRAGTGTVRGRRSLRKGGGIDIYRSYKKENR